RGGFVPRVEELEPRHAPAALVVGPLLNLGPTPAPTSPAVSPVGPDATTANLGTAGGNQTSVLPGQNANSPAPGNVAPPAGATPATGRVNLATAIGLAPNSPFLLTPQVGVVQAVVGSVTSPIVSPNFQNGLPPFLQGASTMPLTGPPTFADLQRLTADFI